MIVTVQERGAEIALLAGHCDHDRPGVDPLVTFPPSRLLCITFGLATETNVDSVPEQLVRGRDMVQNPCVGVTWSWACPASHPLS